MLDILESKIDEPVSGIIRARNTHEKGSIELVRYSE